jgi:hypothetical protein
MNQTNLLEEGNEEDRREHQQKLIVVVEVKARKLMKAGKQMLILFGMFSPWVSG